MSANKCDRVNRMLLMQARRWRTLHTRTAYTPAGADASGFVPHLSACFFAAMRKRRPPRMCSLKGTGQFFRDERGSTTAGMAIALFVAIALIFSGAQVYRVGSAAADIQEVADAAALAAENEVAEFTTLVNVCDATILSLTLLSATLYGVGLVTACIPPLEALSAKLMEAGGKSLEMRDKFHQKVVEGLNKVQKLLPFFSAANAMGVAQANNANGAMQADYLAVAALVPQTGIEFNSIEDGGLAELGSEIDSKADDIREKASQAEAAAEKAAQLKAEAFRYDCGAKPSYCMYERAASLSDISDSDNPLYESVDAWSFSVPLARARAYYSARAAVPVANSGSIEARADSALRKRFYEYAKKELEKAYVFDNGESFSAYFPHLFRNTDEMRATELYTERVYPVTSSATSKTMHAWSGCPNARGYSVLGSISDLDGGGYEKCPKCEFVVSSMGNVALASTSIENGFEFHYERMRQAADGYAQARAELDPLNQAVKEEVSPLLDRLGEILKDCASKRLTAQPPGRYGAVSMVVNMQHNNADTGFESLFVDGGSTLGVRAAVSGATVLADETSEGSGVITRIISGLNVGSSGMSGPLDIAASCWESLLLAYEDGQAALEEGVSNALSSFSHSTSSGLGSWAAGFLEDTIAAVGLEPADIRSRMPVLINTGHITSKDGGSFSVSFSKMKSQALSASSPATGFGASIMGAVANGIEGQGGSDWITVATIGLPLESDWHAIEWILPEPISSSSSDAIEQVISRIGSGIDAMSPLRSWQ